MMHFRFTVDTRTFDIREGRQTITYQSLLTASMKKLCMAFSATLGMILVLPADAARDAAMTHGWRRVSASTPN